jgi:hemolysin III
MAAPDTYTPGEEIANVVTHGIGVALSVAGLVLLATFSCRRGDAWLVTGTTIFGVSLVALYTASTLYHSFRSLEIKRVLRRFDHAAIFLLIAGSYTPFLLVTLRGGRGWSLFAVVWGLAVSGITLKFWFAGRFRVASTLVYLAMGWLVLSVVRPLLVELPRPGFWLLLAGGLCYTGGAVFYLWKRLPYHHAVWHLWVMAGSACHWAAVFFYIVRVSD